MAIGDAAGAKGLKVYSASDLVNLGYQQNNQRGDEIAAVMTRADKLEAQTISVPKFSVRRSTNGQNCAAEKWTQMTAGAWGSPKKSVGGFTWSGGVLTVPRAGVYMVHADAHFYSDDFVTAAAQITRNTTSLDTTNTVAKGEASQYSEPGETTNPSVSAIGFLVPLNAGDQLRVFLLQRNRGGQTRNTGSHEYDLQFEVLWMDNL
ncbi:MAG: hypothetical protein AAGC90_10405 [Curtobacterium sp.]